MVDLTPDIPEGRQVVEAYGGGSFTVSGRAYRGSVLVLPERTLGWPIGSVETLTLESLAPLLERELAIEILLLGCGEKLVLVPGDLRREIRSAGPVLEAMDTGAACRTYNVLASEQRRVGAALIAIK